MFAEFGDLCVAAGHSWILAPVCMGWGHGMFGSGLFPVPTLEMLTSCFGSVGWSQGAGPSSLVTEGGVAQSQLPFKHRFLRTRVCVGWVLFSCFVRFEGQRLMKLTLGTCHLVS